MLIWPIKRWSLINWNLNIIFVKCASDKDVSARQRAPHKSANRVWLTKNLESTFVPHFYSDLISFRDRLSSFNYRFYQKDNLREQQSTPMLNRLRRMTRIQLPECEPWFSRRTEASASTISFWLTPHRLAASFSHFLWQFTSQSRQEDEVRLEVGLESISTFMQPFIPLSTNLCDAKILSEKILKFYRLAIIKR